MNITDNKYFTTDFNLDEECRIYKLKFLKLQEYFKNKYFCNKRTL